MTHKSKRTTHPELDTRRAAKAPVPGSTGASRKPAVVEGPSYAGPAKSDQPSRPRRGKAKDPFVKEDGRRRRTADRELDLPDQKPRRTSRRSEADGMPEQYVRLRIRVRGDRLSVIDSHLVDGPLLADKAFPGTNAYEVTIGDRLLHAGALPDLGMQRSFIEPDAPSEEQTHHFAEREVYEFSARVPAEELTPETIGQVEVRLHRVKGDASAEVLSGQRLDVQFEREMRLIGELRGLPESVLPEEIARRGGQTPNVS